MAGADKRAKLLSDLLATKGGASPEAAKPPQPERTSVIQIAKRRMSEERASEAPAAPSVLYSKGAATASTFRPSYWSFDHEGEAASGPKPALDKVAPAPPPAPVPAAPAPKSRPLPINFVVAFGCVALFVSTTLFVLSQQHRAEPAAAPQTQTAAVDVPAPALAALLPPAPPTESAAQPQPAAPVAPPPQPAPPAPAAVAPPLQPAPAPPMVVAATPTPPAPAAPAVAAEPAPPIPQPTAKASESPDPAAVATSAPTPAPSADTQQAEALLARGDDLMVTGDVAAARLFYQRAAELGSAAAATAVGQTYDPGVLELLRVRGARGDAGMAAEWYRKAIAAGDRQAEIRLKRLLARTSG